MLHCGYIGEQSRVTDSDVTSISDYLWLTGASSIFRSAKVTCAKWRQTYLTVADPLQYGERQNPKILNGVNANTQYSWYTCR